MAPFRVHPVDLGLDRDQTRRMKLRTLLAALAVTLVLAAGCGDDSPGPKDTSARETSPGETPTETETTSVEPIVGEWQRVTTCQQRVKALRQEGLERYAAEQVAGDGFIPGVTDKSQIKDPSRPCADAVPMNHSHFFTEDGEFGSRDDAGMQVDDGPYRLLGSDKVLIGGADHEVTFRYEIDGDALRLYPELPACVKRGCFPAQWAVAVSYNGLPWQKIS